MDDLQPALSCLCEMKPHFETFLPFCHESVLSSFQQRRSMHVSAYNVVCDRQFGTRSHQFRFSISFSLYACVCAHVCIHVCQGVITENKGLVVQSETVGFEVRWKMLFCLAEQTQWSHSASPLTAHCPTTTSPQHMHAHTHACTHGCRGLSGIGGERGMK